MAALIASVSIKPRRRPWERRRAGSALLKNFEAAEVDAKMKPVLRYVRKLTVTPSEMSEADAQGIFAAGWDERALHDAVSVCALFNFMNRFVDGLGIQAGPDYFRLASERLSKGGYAVLARMVRETEPAPA